MTQWPACTSRQFQPPLSQREESESHINKLSRILLIAAVLVGVIWLGRQLGGELLRLIEWVNAQGFWAPILFVAIYAAATVAFVPGSLLTLAAGAVFGLPQGVVYAFAGAVLGSSCAFLLARHGLRPWVERRIAADPRFERIDTAVARDGRKIVLLLRLSPALPYNLLNYALGLTRVRFGDYLVAAVGMLPGTVLYVYSGRVAGDLATLAAGAGPARDTAYYLVLALGLIATGVVTFWITRIARRALAQETGVS